MENLKWKAPYGEEIKALFGMVKSEFNKDSASNSENTTRKKRKALKPVLGGSLSFEGKRSIQTGLEILRRVFDDIIENQESNALLGNVDVSKNISAIIRYRYVIDDILIKMQNDIKLYRELQEKIDNARKRVDIYQAARDGVLKKTEEKTVIINGETQRIPFETPMTLKEVKDILDSYENMSEQRKSAMLNNYLNLGFAIIGLIGSLQDIKSTETKVMTLGTITISSIKIIKEILNDKEYGKLWDSITKGNRLLDELNEHEPMNEQDKKDQLNAIKGISIMESTQRKKIYDRNIFMNTGIDAFVAIIIGAYTKNRVIMNENGKFDGKAFASILSSLHSMKGIAGNMINAIYGFREVLASESEYRAIAQSACDIINQMEEKVYPLQGAKEKFDSISINDFKGSFYDETNLYTGETDFKHIIKISEFSIKRGETVLLTGDSGSGKSTFLRWLKRGDINNREGITLNKGKDNERKVDNLGNQYISYRPSSILGDESSALFQITGKESLSRLKEQKKNKLLEIIRQLHIYEEATTDEEILNGLARKKYMEYSTGQQNRLVLARLLYRINDKISIIIVDEPAGNVEDTLIQEQLSIIKQYAEKHNLMLLLITHRVDLAKQYVTKRYHIQIQSGILSQVPLDYKAEDNSVKDKAVQPEL